MGEAPSPAAVPNAEHEIAAALIAEVQDRANDAIEYRFNDGKHIFVLKVTRRPIELEEEKGMYVSLGPPGKTCRCCGGSGKRP